MANDHLTGLRAARERCRTYTPGNGAYWLSRGVPLIKIGPRGGKKTFCHRPTTARDAAEQIERDPTVIEYG